MEFEPGNYDHRENLSKGDGKLCTVGDICKNAIKGICNLLNCKNFKSKVKGKGKNSPNQNDNRLDF